jgi:hypothetical protein
LRPSYRWIWTLTLLATGLAAALLLALVLGALQLPPWAAGVALLLLLLASSWRWPQRVQRALAPVLADAARCIDLEQTADSLHPNTLVVFTTGRTGSRSRGGRQALAVLAATLSDGLLAAVTLPVRALAALPLPGLVSAAGFAAAAAALAALVLAYLVGWTVGVDTAVGAAGAAGAAGGAGAAGTADAARWASQAGLLRGDAGLVAQAASVVAVLVVLPLLAATALALSSALAAWLSLALHGVSAGRAALLLEAAVERSPRGASPTLHVPWRRSSRVITPFDPAEPLQATAYGSLQGHPGAPLSTLGSDDVLDAFVAWLDAVASRQRQSNINPA